MKIEKRLYSIVILIFVTVNFTGISAHAMSCFAAINPHVAKQMQELKLAEMKRDIPEIQDAFKFVEEFKEKQRQWNSIYRFDRNNFSVPEFSSVVSKAKELLAKIKRPAENRAMAEKLIRDLNELEASHYPYKNTFVKIDQVSQLLSLKHRDDASINESSVMISELLRELPQAKQNENARMWEVIAKGQKLEDDPIKFLAEDDALGGPKWTAVTDYIRLSILDIKKFLHTPEGQETKEAFLRQYEFTKNELAKHIKEKGTFDQKEIGYLNARLAKYEDLLDPTSTDRTMRLLRPTVFSGLRTSVSQRSQDLDSILEKNIFLLVARPQSIEGLAQSYLIGIKPIELARGIVKADGRRMDSKTFLEHDIDHALFSALQAASEVLNLSLSDRIEILSNIERLKTPRQKELAYYTLYSIIHEVDQSFVVTTPQEESKLSMISRIYQDNTGKKLDISEARWALIWYQLNVNAQLP